MDSFDELIRSTTGVVLVPARRQCSLFRLREVLLRVPCGAAAVPSAARGPVTRLPDGVEVDRTLAPLLWDLRQRGVDTRASCEQDGDGRAYIMVIGAVSVEVAMRRCLELATEIGDRALVWRVHGLARYLPPRGGRPEQMVGPDGWSVAGDLRPPGLVGASTEPVMVFRIDLPTEDVVTLSQYVDEHNATTW